MHSESSFPVYCLSLVTWVIISQLLLLTFDRVVRRHKKEAILQNSGVWEPASRDVREVFRAPSTREDSLLGGRNLTYPDVPRSARTSSSIISDPFRSRRNSWSSELSSGLDPMHGGTAPGSIVSTISSSLHPQVCMTSSPVPSSPRSAVASTIHILPRKSSS